MSRVLAYLRNVVAAPVPAAAQLLQASPAAPLALRCALTWAGDAWGADDGRPRDDVVTGQVFFASSEAFVAAFDLREALERVRLVVTHAHLWDITAIPALDKVIMKFCEHGAQVEVSGLNPASQTMGATEAVSPAH